MGLRKPPPPFPSPSDFTYAPHPTQPHPTLLLLPSSSSSNPQPRASPELLRESTHPDSILLKSFSWITAQLTFYGVTEARRLKEEEAREKLVAIVEEGELTVPEWLVELEEEKKKAYELLLTGNLESMNEAQQTQAREIRSAHAAAQTSIVKSESSPVVKLEPEQPVLSSSAIPPGSLSNPSVKIEPDRPIPTLPNPVVKPEPLAPSDERAPPPTFIYAPPRGTKSPCFLALPSRIARENPESIRFELSSSSSFSRWKEDRWVKAQLMHYGVLETGGMTRQEALERLRGMFVGEGEVVVPEWVQEIRRGFEQEYDAKLEAVEEEKKERERKQKELLAGMSDAEKVAWEEERKKKVKEAMGKRQRERKEREEGRRRREEEAVERLRKWWREVFGESGKRRAEEEEGREGKRMRLGSPTRDEDSTMFTPPPPPASEVPSPDPSSTSNSSPYIPPHAHYTLFSHDIASLSTPGRSQYVEEDEQAFSLEIQTMTPDEECVDPDEYTDPEHEEYGKKDEEERTGCWGWLMCPLVKGAVPLLPMPTKVNETIKCTWRGQAPSGWEFTKTEENTGEITFLSGGRVRGWFEMCLPAKGEPFWLYEDEEDEDGEGGEGEGEGEGEGGGEGGQGEDGEMEMKQYRFRFVGEQVVEEKEPGEWEFDIMSEILATWCVRDGKNDDSLGMRDHIMW